VRGPVDLLQLPDREVGVNLGGLQGAFDDAISPLSRTACGRALSSTILRRCWIFPPLRSRKPSSTSWQRESKKSERGSADDERDDGFLSGSGGGGASGRRPLTAASLVSLVLFRASAAIRHMAWATALTALLALRLTDAVLPEVAVPGVPAFFKGSGTDPADRVSVAPALRSTPVTTRAAETDG
jgi:hypothetical protein